MTCLPPPIPMNCENCGESLAFDPKHGVLAHPRSRDWVRWSCPNRSGLFAAYRGRYTLGRRS